MSPREWKILGLADIGHGLQRLKGMNIKLLMMKGIDKIKIFGIFGAVHKSREVFEGGRSQTKCTHPHVRGEVKKKLIQTGIYSTLKFGLKSVKIQNES